MNMHKVGEIVIIEILLGDVIIGEVSKMFSDGNVQLKQPKTIIITEEQEIMMIPYSPFSADEHLIFSRESIVTSYYPISGIQEAYLQKDIPEKLN
jgi:hypothetical protein